jgi:hypothetical protein
MAHSSTIHPVDDGANSIPPLTYKEDRDDFLLPRQDVGRDLMHRFVCAVMVVTSLLVYHKYPWAEAAAVQPSAKSATPPKSETPLTQQRNGSPTVVHALDFSDYATTSVEAWLQSKGLKFEEAAKDRDLLNLPVQDGALILEAKEALRGILVQEPLDVKMYSKIRIEWGVLKYPAGASYEKDIRNEPIMVLVFFGTEKISSGHLIHPDLPYFIGLYLGQDDTVNVPYKGKSYHAGGRYVCLGNPQLGDTITSEFDLVQAFQTYFAKPSVPPISGLALEVDTTSSGNGGTAAAFIKRIEILE